MRYGWSGVGAGVLFPLLLALIAVSACNGSPETQRPPTLDTPADARPTAPWSGPTLTAEEVPAEYLAAWGDAENRDWCALLAFDHPPPRGADVAAQPRVARFGGGWGVAYDLPDLRSAFGVAGTGVEPGPDTYDDWPHRREWRDGSRADYGPEGGSGPKQLAYLRVEGQRCLYNVWSHLGRTHLEELLESLRFVEPTQGGAEE